METQGLATTAVKSEGHHGGDIITTANSNNFNVTYVGEVTEQFRGLIDLTTYFNFGEQRIDTERENRQ